jgi:hypothetical protein
MDLIKKHVDTVIVLGGIIGSILWMNHKFTQVDQRFASLEKDMAVIKTVMFMQGHLPKELMAISEEK